MTNAIEVLPPSARYSLRLRAEDAAGLRLPDALPLGGSINTCLSAGPALFARLGPDEWMILAPPPELEPLQRTVAETLAGRFYSLVDVSSRNCAFRISGPCSREILNGGCPLDLDDSAFPAGSATRTVFGKSEVILLRPGRELSFRLECWRSFSGYVRACLEHSRPVAASES